MSHTSGPVDKASRDATLKRAEELDALDAILPFDRRDQLAALPTDDDVATLKHLPSEGMGDNTLRALASDLGYLETWCQLATGSPPPLAGAGKPAAEIRCSSPLGSAQTRGRSKPWHAAGLRLQRLLRADGPHAPEGPSAAG